MSTKYKVIAGVVVVVTAYAFGYWTAPYKTKVEVKTVEVEKQHDVTHTDTTKHQKVTKVEDTKPSGEKVVTTTTEDVVDRRTSSVQDESMNKATDSLKEVTKSSSPVTISFLTGASLTSGLGPATLVYGGSITKSVMGPIAIGLFGMSNGVVGGSLGLQF